MATVSPESGPNPRPPKRRLWQHALRALVAGGLALGVVYVTLPWWLPTGLLRDRLASDLSEQTGCDVRIGALSVSWGGGVDIRNLVIQNPDGFEGDPLLQISRLRAEFSPLSFLAGNALEYVEIEDPHLRVQFDETGQSNLDPLSRLDGETPLRVSVHQAVVDVSLPRASHTIRIDVGDAQVLSGRLKRVAHVTMSAALRQEAAPAPVSFRLQAEPTASSAASASLHFSNIQLDQLPLNRLDLPVNLTGVCGGQLNLQLNGRGVVERFDLNLLVRQLDVGEPGFDLPTLDEARLSVSATLDPLGSTTEFKRVQLLLPGLELTGRASLRTDLQGGEDGRLPFLIQQVDIQGTLDPSAMAWLLGRATVAGDVELQGPVVVAFGAVRRDQSLRLDLSVDATETAIRRGNDVLKPSARRLRYELSGELDDRGWRFAVDRSSLRLGENRFEGSGSVRELARLLETYGRQGDVTLEGVLSDLRLMSGNGSCTVNDPRSLTDLFPPLEPLLRDVRLKGAVHGAFELDHHDGESGGTELVLRLTAPAETELTVGSLVKPAGRSAAFVLQGALEPRTLTLNDVRCEARLGQAYLCIQKARLRVGTERDAGVSPASCEVLRETPRLDLDVVGDFVAMRIEDLFLILPESDRPSLRGSLHGTFALQTDGVQWRANVQADATQAALDAGPLLVKPGGQTATAELDVYYSTDPARDRSAEFAVNIGLPLGEFQARANTLADGGFAATGKATLRDASLLAATVPLTEQALAGATLTGEVTVSFDVKQAVYESFASAEHPLTTFSLTLNADALAIAPAPAASLSDASPLMLASRQKSAGTPLSFQATGWFTSDGKRTDLLLVIADDTVKFRPTRYTGGRMDESRFDAHMHLQWSRRDESAEYDIQQFSVGGFGGFVLTDSLCQLLPELTPLVHQYGLAGAVRLDGVFRYSSGDASYGPGYTLGAHVDASRLSFRDLATLTKPAGVLLWATVDASASADLKTLHATAKVNAAETILDARAEFVNTNTDGGRWPILPRLSSARASVDCRNAELLSGLMPALEPYRLHGGATVELELGGGDTPVVRALQVNTDRLLGVLGGKEWRAHGDLRVEGLDLFDPAGPRADRVVARELELTLGDNHAWLLADVQNLPTGPRGDVQLLAEFLHDKDILDWIDGLTQNAPGDDPAAVAPRPEEAADDLLARLRQALTSADLRVSVSANTFRTLDTAVDRTYDVRMFHLDTDIRQGYAQAGYRGGLNGGLVRTHYEANLNDPAAVVVQEIDLRELQSDEALQPQMALFFPGNTVHGMFTRQGRLSAPLRDVLAATLDPRVPVRWVGQVKTITTDGFVEGQSAPKFVTRIFPGLNLTRYKYTTMTGFAEFLPDGSVRNDMLFSGGYDVYMEGATGPDHWGKYEIGLCLAPASPEWNHDWKQGRIPILKFQGRIEGGQIHDQEVSYLWPNELLFKMFLERNVVYRAWVMRQK